MDGRLILCLGGAAAALSGAGVTLGNYAAGAALFVAAVILIRLGHRILDAEAADGA